MHALLIIAIVCEVISDGLAFVYFRRGPVTETTSGKLVTQRIGYTALMFASVSIVSMATISLSASSYGLTDLQVFSIMVIMLGVFAAVGFSAETLYRREKAAKRVDTTEGGEIAQA